MVICEQFIFTAAKIDGNEGYQVIAKSQGISSELVENIREYLFPSRINEEEFQSSKSLIELNKNHIAYSIVKNIGVGYDGRRGTLYNHTFVVEKKDFEEMYNDSRLFDNSFIENPSLRGELKTIQIKPVENPPNFKILNELTPAVLKSLLFRLFKKTQIALLKTDEIEIIQNLLVMLPFHLRVTSFSTLVNDPLRQHQYVIMQIPQSAENKLSSRRIIIDPKNLKPLNIPAVLEDLIELLLKIIINSNKSEWIKIVHDYKKLSIQPSIIKRIKLKDIFDVSQYGMLAKTEKYSIFKQKVKNLYSSKKFHQASPRVMLNITKKIRKIIQKEFKKQMKLKTTQTLKNKQLVDIMAILLDCINYLDGYTSKKISPSVKSEVDIEKTKIMRILDENSPTTQPEYVFDPWIYVKVLYANAVNYSQAIAAMFFGR